MPKSTSLKDYYNKYQPKILYNTLSLKIQKNSTAKGIDPLKLKVTLTGYPVIDFRILLLKKL